MDAPARLGPYRVTGVLHAGKHSNIYNGEGPNGERVAVKTIDPRVASRHHMSERFLRGARAAISASSPYLVKVFDVGMAIETGHLWCAMELIEGETLAARLAKRGKRPYDRSAATRVTSQIARALGALHRAGVVHRNVKPGNVMLTPKSGFDHFVTLVGMGLVKPLEQERGVELTSRGAVIGTPAYLAPEALVDSTQVDETADVYSLGVVLYELLSGELPFPGSTVIEQLVQKQEGAKPLETTPSLKRLLIRMLAADRKRRPTSMSEVIDVLGDSVEEQTHRDEWTRADKVQVNLNQDVELDEGSDGTRLGHKAREMFDVSTDQPTEKFQVAKRRADPATDRRPAAKPARAPRPVLQPARVVRPAPQPARVVRPPPQPPRPAAPLPGVPREVPTDPTSRRASTDPPGRPTDPPGRTTERTPRSDQGDYVDADATEIDPGFGHRR